VFPPEVLALATAFASWETVLMVIFAEIAGRAKAKHKEKDTQKTIRFLKNLLSKLVPPLSAIGVCLAFLGAPFALKVYVKKPECLARKSGDEWL
jgi:hypothetical protein